MGGPVPLPEVLDEVLFKRVREGDMRAFDELYSRYEQRLFCFIKRYLARSEDAEEVFHEAFMKVLKSREIKFDRGSFCTWLYRIARNLSLNRLRSHGRSEKAAWEFGAEVAADSNLFPTENKIDESKLLGALTSAVKNLSQPLFEIYRLRSSGMSYEEMAHILDIPLGTVKSRMFEMVGQLREEVELWNVR